MGEHGRARVSMGVHVCVHGWCNIMCKACALHVNCMCTAREQYYRRLATYRHALLESCVELLARRPLGREVLGAQPQLLGPVLLWLVKKSGQAGQPAHGEVVAAAEALRGEVSGQSSVSE